MPSLEIWTEKYRPEKLSEVAGQEKIIERLRAFVKERGMPHMLFAGPAGIGKTTSAIAMAKELYGNEWQRNFLELNASDERGINVVREKIKEFARIKPFNAEFKIIFLDECDALTTEAQQALRRTMEKYTSTTRFILSCNYSSKIIPPIQSRCAVFRFSPLKVNNIEKELEKIAKHEKIELTAEGLELLIKVSEGDMRKAINILQSVAITSKKIGEKQVLEVSAFLHPKEAKEILDLALNKEFLKARDKLTDLMLIRGLSGLDVIKSMHREIIGLEKITEKQKAQLIDKLGEYEFRIVQGGTEDIQIEAFLAQVSALD